MSPNYHVFTKYIDLLHDDTFGEWFNGRNSDSKECQLPFVIYSKVAHDLIEDIIEFSLKNNITKYGDILEENGIRWDFEAMNSADVNILTKEAIFGLLLGAVRAERFCEGILLEFFEKGTIQRWLISLRDKIEG